MSNKAFTLVEERALKEVCGIARLWKHNATGAQILSVVNEDENKVFGASFRTPPKDSTGVAHILEHSVLCGSEKYPLKEPFVNLLKGSLQTFLNAFTYPDKTCYPVASANLQDFYNLIDVYMDAVLHPLISENTFRQEGWHIEAPTADGPWEYRGVVYNEMKGVYSSSNSRLGEESQHAMFPDTLYSLDSGGRPACIPDLTYEAFRDFHASYYHPSNGRFFFWGDDPEEERLAIMERWLEGYAFCSVDSSIPMQPAFDAPRRIEIPYAVSEDDSKAKSLFTVNWLAGDRCDTELSIVLEMLSHILEGMSGSPLRRALISSGLGEDMAGQGLESELRQMYYSTGLRGIEEGDVAKAEELIFSTLSRLADEGIDPSTIEAAVNVTEFAYRENNTGGFPRGLSAMLQALSTWLYDANPLDAMAWEAPLARIKARLAQGEKVFENAIRTIFLDNPSRCTVVLVPDKELAARTAAEEKARVDAVQARADATERARICEITRVLKEAQEAQDTPEAQACIPNLVPDDMPRKNKIIPIKVDESTEVVRISHALPTSGIAYASLLLPMPDLSANLASVTPFLTRSLTEAGTARHDYTKLGELIAAKTGALAAHRQASTRMDGECRCYLNLAGKTVYDKADDLFALEREVLLEPQTDHAILEPRLREMLLETKARIEQSVIASGHATTTQRLRARMIHSAAFAEQAGGIEQLRKVRALLDNWESAKEGFFADLSKLRTLLLASGGAIADCICEAGQEEALLDGIASLASALPKASPCKGTQTLPLLEACPAEVFVVPSQVNYVGKGCHLANLGYTYRGCDEVIMRYLRMGYLWDRVRVRGGAYGCFCSLTSVTGCFTCTSYRDPNVESTLAAYDGIAEFLRTCDLDSAELGRAIVGAVGDVDTYLLPDRRGGMSLSNWLTGISEEQLQIYRDQMLSTTLADFRNFADVMDEAAKKGSICVVGGNAAGELAAKNGWKCENLFQ